MAWSFWNTHPSAVKPHVKIDAYILVICRSHHKKRAACMTIALSHFTAGHSGPWQGLLFTPNRSVRLFSPLLHCTSGLYKPLQLLVKLRVHFGGSEPQKAPLPRGREGTGWILMRDLIKAPAVVLHLPLSP